MQMPSKSVDTCLSSDIYDAAVAGMKKATRLNHNAAATRKTSPQISNGLASLGPLFQSELKMVDHEATSPIPRISRHVPTSSNRHRANGSENEKQANSEIVWPSVRFSN
jgi:hypothetical protein